MSESVNRQAIVRVSQELILSALKFPLGTQILRLQMTAQGDIELVCQHDSLPEVERGNPIPRLTPCITHVPEHFKFFWSHEDAKAGKEVL